MKGILIDRESGDLSVVGGSMIVGENDAQVAEELLLANRGDFKEYPLLGGEVGRMLGGERDVMWAPRVKKMLRACGLEVSRIRVTEQEIMIE